MSDDLTREERAFTEAFRTTLEGEQFRPLDPDAVRPAAGSPRRLRPWVKGLAAAAVVVLAIGGGGFALSRLGLASSPSSGSVEAQPAAAGGAAPDHSRVDGAPEPAAVPSTSMVLGPAAAWITTSPAPLSPRVDASVAWFDGTFYVVGGRQPFTCPPGARCPAPRNEYTDGAAYDPVTDSWQQLPDAPLVVTRAAPVVVGSRLYYLGVDSVGASAFAAFAPDSRTWQSLPAPRDADALIAADDKVVGITHGTDVGQLFDPANGTWSDLPPDPYPDTLGRSAVWVDGRLLLFSLQEGAVRKGAKQPVGVARLDLAAHRWTKVRMVAKRGTPVAIAGVIAWLDGGGGRLSWTDPGLTPTGGAPAVAGPPGLDGVDGVVAGNRLGVNGTSVISGHLYDFDSHEWVPLAPPPSGNVVFQSVAGSPSGLLVVGGPDGAGHVATAYLPLE